MKTSEYPVWLAVMPDDRENAKKAAGRLEGGQPAIVYDQEAKLWYARPGADLDRLGEWMPDPSKRLGGGDVGAQFLDALTQAGLVIKGMPVMDGNMHRVMTIEDKKGGKQSGVYRGFDDRRPGGWFINYHRASHAKDGTNWKAEIGGEANPVTSLHIRAGARQAHDDGERIRAEKHAQKTLEAKTLYERLSAADPEHPYAVRKGITLTPDIRQTRNGALVVPFFNAAGDFKTLQYIPPAGEKFLYKDAPKQGNFLVVGGTLGAGQPVLYAEGYATARSLNMALGLPVVMTIDSGNMVAVAQELKGKYPDSKHLFMADYDHAKDENKGLIMANQAAELVGGHVIYPLFSDEEKALGYTDFNDLHKSQGLKSVSDQVGPVLLLSLMDQMPSNKEMHDPVNPAFSDNGRSELDNDAQQVSAPGVDRTQGSNSSEPVPVNKEIYMQDDVAPPPVAIDVPDQSKGGPETPDASPSIASQSYEPVMSPLQRTPGASPQLNADVSLSFVAAPTETLPSIDPSESAPGLRDDPLAEKEITQPPVERSPDSEAPLTQPTDAELTPFERNQLRALGWTDEQLWDIPAEQARSVLTATAEGQESAAPNSKQANVDQEQSESVEAQTIVPPQLEKVGDEALPVDDPVIDPLQASPGPGKPSVDKQTEPDTIWVGAPRPSGNTDAPQFNNVDLDALRTRITNEVQADKSVLYKLDGEPAFIDRGMRLEMAEGASQSDEKIIAALVTAAEFYRGRIELTGSDAFKAKAISLIALHQINVTMKVPDQQAQLVNARQALNTPSVDPDAVTGDSPPPYGAAAAPADSQPAAPMGPAMGELRTVTEPMASSATTMGSGNIPPRATSAAAQADLELFTPAAPMAAATVQQPTEQAPQAEVANDPVVKKRKGATAEIHQSPKAAERGVIGKVMDFGPAPYEFDNKNDESNFIMLRTKSSGVQTFWGKELAGLIRDTRIELGSMVNLQWLGQKPVTINVPQRDAEGVTTGYVEKSTHRNQWSLNLLGHPSVRTGQDEGVKLTAYDTNRFAQVQQTLLTRLKLDMPLPVQREGLFWMTPNGEGSTKSGDELTALRPKVDSTAAGQMVMSSWSDNGHLDMMLVRGDGPFLQGIVRQNSEYRHVLVSLPGTEGAPPMVFNAITERGLIPIGAGNGINRSGGQAVSRESIAFKLDGDSATRIGKLDFPSEIPPNLHARLGFDERYRDDNALPKSGPVAAPSVHPSDPRPS